MTKVKQKSNFSKELMHRIFAYALLGLLFIFLPSYNKTLIPLAILLFVGLVLSLLSNKEGHSQQALWLNAILLSLLFIALGARYTMTYLSNGRLLTLIALCLWAIALLLPRIHFELSHRFYFRLLNFHTTPIGAIIAVLMFSSIPKFVRLARDTGDRGLFADKFIGILLLFCGIASGYSLSHALCMKEHYKERQARDKSREAR